MKKIKNLLILILAIIFTGNVYAATATTSITGTNTVKVGNTTKIYIKLNASDLIEGVDVTYAASGNIQVTNAVIGSAGNPNEMYLEYSNNPNAGGEGDTDKTPKDKVIVFTYKVVANKTDGNTALTGAAFELFKKVVTVDATGQTSEAWVSRGKVGLNSDGKSDNTTTWKVMNVTKESFAIGCLDGYVEILKLKPFGKKVMDTKSFLNGVNKENVKNFIIS